MHAVLRAGLQNAMRDELVTRNVAKLVQVPASVCEVGHGARSEQARTLLAAAKADRLSALYVVAVYLGLRRASCWGSSGSMSTSRRRRFRWFTPCSA